MTAVKKIKVEPKQYSFVLQTSVSAINIENFAKQIDSTSEGSIVTFDFKNVKVIEKSCYSSMYRLRTVLQKQGFVVQCLNISSNLQEILKADGALNIFFDKLNLEKNNKKKIDVNFISPFINATLNALKVQAHVEAKGKSPILKENQNFNVDIAGVISLVSDAFVGTISLCFPSQTFLNICSGLFGEDCKEINNEIQDAAGELLNMIFGAAKAEINQKHGYEIKRALPTVIVGNSLKLKQSVGPTIVLPFESTAGSFHLEIEVVDRQE